jgi:uncharacterized protein YbjT (DUF2867 family)
VINPKKNRILVIGATGNQGGGVVQALLSEGFTVQALVRKPTSDKAQRLRGQGVELIEGNLDDYESLIGAMNDVDGVFYPSIMSFRRTEAEEERGRRVAEAVLKAGVKHYIYDSVGGADRKSGIPHFESKWRIEEYIRSIKLPYTIFRPVAFMENFSMVPPFLFLTLFRSVMGDKSLQLISVRDIGKWVTLAFSQPDSFMGKATEIAGDELNYEKLQEAYRNVTGKQQFCLKMPSFIFGGGGKMFRWFKKHGYQADLQFCRETIKDTLTFEKWLVLQKSQR